MDILNVSHLFYSYGEREIFRDANFRLLPGEHTALIGENGEGKSTFLSLITDKLKPDAGKIEWARRVRVGYLDQHASLTPGLSIREVLRSAFAGLIEAEQKMLAAYDKMAEASPEEMDTLLKNIGNIQERLEASDYYTLDARIEEVAGGIGLFDLGLERQVDELSGGQRTKVLLAKLLLQDADVLLLDEPTNYLDTENIDWLTNYLQRDKKAFILVSHDIPFLNAVTNVIYHADNLQLTRYPGNYEKFKELSALKQAQAEEAYKRQQVEIKREKNFIARNKARAATHNLAASRQKRLDKMQLLTKHSAKPQPHFYFQPDRTPSRLVIDAHDLVLGYDKPLTRPLDIRIERNQKIAICGMNGLGKSTLLKTLLGLIPPLAGTLEQGEFVSTGYFEQESPAGNQNTALEELWQAYPGLSNSEVRAALARCGLTPENMTTKMMVLSGGEAAKVRLCKIMQKPVNLLALDEPTNHLDAEAKQELKRALMAYKGTVICISHEPEFYQDWVDDIWNIEDWTQTNK